MTQPSAAITAYLGGLGDGASILSTLDDLADLFEQGAADGAPIREIVGEDPVDFIETFVRDYPKGQWILRERERLTRSIARAAGATTADEGMSR